MRNIFLIFFLFSCAAAFAKEVKITLVDEQTKQKHYYSFDTDAMTIRTAESATGRALPETSKYSAKDRRLIVNRQQIADADELLYQGQVDGFEIVIVRREQTSYASVGRMIAAARGDPVKVSAIIVIKLNNNVAVTQREITKRGASQRLTALVSQ